MPTATVPLKTLKTTKLPEAIHVPKYLETYINKLDIPKYIDMSFILNIGTTLLAAKIASVESFNMNYPQRKKKIPDKLDFDDAAIILMALFQFRNIQMTERADDTILGMYINNETSKKHGIYVTSVKYIYELMERLAPTFKTKDMQDVIDKIQRSVETVEQTKDKTRFIVNNGIYDQTINRLLPFSPDYVYLTKIPIDYKENPPNIKVTAPDGYVWDVDTWIRDLATDDDTCTLIWQVIADCLQPNYSRHKSIWFYSEKGNNGKGTIGQLIKNLVGRGNYASLSVSDFNHEFLKETLIGVATNISDENDVDVYIDSIKDYKASVTGDDININRKYEKPLRIQFLGTNIQMMNGLPKTKDKSDSFYRRLILVPFLKSFTNNGERKYIKNTYIHQKEILEYVLFKALQMEFDEYIVPKSSAELMESYKEKNNPVLEFWNELKDEFVWDLLPTQFLYDLFLKWSEQNNPSGKAMSKRTFTDNLSNVIHTAGDPWEPKTGQNDKVKTNNRMDKDEPLISEYGLDRVVKNAQPTPWMNKASITAGSNSPTRMRDFPRKDAYRGYLRL